jgi:hypothetical protein
LGGVSSIAGASGSMESLLPDPVALTIGIDA